MFGRVSQIIAKRKNEAKATVDVQSGFALPTVLIASFVMISILTVILTTTVTGIVAAIDSSHYDRYAKSAAQSGLVMAQSCLKANNYVPTWSSPKQLTPTSSCTGSPTSAAVTYLHNDTTQNVRSTFTVAAPVTVANGVQKLVVKATAERYRESTGAVWRTYTQSSFVTISAQSSFSSVAFGYQANGAFFGIIDPQGFITAAGYNGNGQLGNGSTSNTLTPVSYALPANLRGSQLFTSFLSVGYDLFAITTDGQLYGAGANSAGQLGSGTATTSEPTPVKFQLPAGVGATYVSQGTNFTFVIGTDNNVYSAGSCTDGALGYTYNLLSCSNQPFYKRVDLPAVNTSDPNTLPVATSDWVQSTNLVTDRASGFVRMQGGKVYGWGLNNRGQLGTGAAASTATPVQVTNLGNSGQPTATQVSFDGDSTWILDSNGDVWASGSNTYGELGTASSINSTSGKCINNPSNSTTDGTQIQIYDCSNTPGQLSQTIEWAENGTLIFRPNSSTTKCIENANGSSSNGNPIQLATCNTSSAQKWTMNTDGKIVNAGTNKCLENPGNATANNTNLQLNACNSTVGYAAQTWPLKDVLTPTKIVLPAGHGKAARVSTDQWSMQILMTDGTVWGYGLNTAGQLGNGGTSKFNPSVQQFALNLTGGLKATNFYTTKTGSVTNVAYGNTFAVLSDGTVWGAGGNSVGQLGNNGTSSTPVTTPVKMVLPTGVAAQSVQTGLGTTVVLTSDGKIYTVGNNANGQLGDGTTNNSSTPAARGYVNKRPVVLY